MNQNREIYQSLEFINVDTVNVNHRVGFRHSLGYYYSPNLCFHQDNYVDPAKVSSTIILIDS